eukprot:TRINITY_DN59995_c0_g1_i1.p1 TRINITY_DN59995_c0_g1~~TRINITY_DN59995_c0_g1_i1.p1  ORF type:complete len:413 (+),score=123.38 TRINITY_DN59995_c0_g1_i1:75-1241(+)
MHAPRRVAAVCCVFAALAAGGGVCAAGVQESCPEAPLAPKDRRADRGRVSFASYNLYWLFDGIDDHAGAPWGTEARADEHIRHMARQLDRVDADVYVLQEVEHCGTLSALRAAMANGTQYECYLVQGADSATGQDVALLTRIDPSVALARTEQRASYPVSGSQCTNTRSGTQGVSKHFYTELQLAPGFAIGVVGLHFLAYPDRADRCPKREGQAAVIGEIIRERFAPRLAAGTLQGVAVLGDFNDFSTGAPDARGSRPGSRAVELVKTALHPPMREAAARLPQQERYTAGYGSYASQLDHVLLSSDLDDLVESVRIVHSDAAGQKGAQSAAWKENGGSDHWPMVVTLRGPASGSSAPSPLASPSGGPRRTAALGLAAAAAAAAALCPD